MESEDIKGGYQLTEVGIIPEDWEVKKIGDICDFIVPGRNKPKKFDGKIPWITTPDLEDGRGISYSKLGLAISKEEVEKVGTRIVPSGSVLMSCAGELGIVAITNNELVINQQLHAFLRSSSINSVFLMNAIKMQKGYINSIATKTAVTYLNKNNCNSIPIPYPSLEEQEKIAQVLSDFDSAIAHFDKLISKKRNLKQGTMQQLLTGKKRLSGFSGEWEEKTLGEICDYINDGTHATPEYVPNGIPFLSFENVTTNNFKKVKLISEKEHNKLIKRCHPKKGDILLTRIGTLGETKLIDWDIEASIYVSLALLKINKKLMLIIYIDILKVNNLLKM